MQVETLLGSIPPFAGLSEPQRRIIDGAMEQRSYRAGEDIFVQGADADGLLVLTSGQAVLFRTDADGSQTPLATLAAGQSINHEALFGEALQSATLRAARPSTLLKLSRAEFARIIVQHRDIRAAFEDDSADSSVLINPGFAEQREDEEILIKTHRHWWSFIRTAWLPLLLMPAMWVAAFLVDAQTFAIALIALSVALPGLGLVYFYLEWRNDSVIVTDQRIIRITRTILALHRQVTQVGMESIHEINFDIPSYDPFARIFRYGTVIVKTAGAQGNLELPSMPNPEKFQQLIMEDRKYFENRQAQRHHKLVRAEMQRWLAGEAAQDDMPAASADGPPQPLSGSNSYLSTRIEMSNGDIVYRKHISVWAQHTALPLLTILTGLAAVILTFTLISPDIRIVTFPASMVALLAGCLTFYWLDWDWRNDVYIISDDTITLVHKRPFFLQNLRDQILVERIDNVESVSTGLFAALFKYGDVSMSLVGADEPKRFVKVPNPRAIQQEISRRQHNKAQRRAHYDAIQQQQMLGEYLGVSPAADGGKLAAEGATAAAIGADPLTKSRFPSEANSTAAIQAAQGSDRNRPPRLPRKLPTPLQPPSSPQIDLPSGRRPQRFRPNSAD